MSIEFLSSVYRRFRACRLKRIGSADGSWRGERLTSLLTSRGWAMTWGVLKQAPASDRQHCQSALDSNNTPATLRTALGNATAVAETGGNHPQMREGRTRSRRLNDASRNPTIYAHQCIPSVQQDAHIASLSARATLDMANIDPPSAKLKVTLSLQLPPHTPWFQCCLR